ncbi:MAG: [FeFe] hydrogenase H-cluster radical SAM maturase HydE [Phycisphaerae bacterium]|nr:[FeFe] hydrogenase H-cluster radical SAM maturase HydE [Phycisphaerae bacterium]
MDSPRLDSLLKQTRFSHQDIVALLSLDEPTDVECLRKAAEAVTFQYCSNLVYYRGIVEFSNRCALDCHYCGIRRSNTRVGRFTLTKAEIVEAALWCASEGYGSVVLQSGERKDPSFIDFVEDIILTLKADSVSEALPRGLGITLCVGEQTPETYQRFFNAGAHRYLLRIETTDPGLFHEIHPENQTLDSRLACLRSLQAIGYQVGTGVMIGLPGQTLDMLARDVTFFRDFDIDMIGMGPYIRSQDTPLPGSESIEKSSAFKLGLKMIAVTRLVCRDINIAATTALQALEPDGREQGITFGANVTMPNLTPTEVRKDYQLYDGKPCINEGKGECRSCLLNRVRSVGREVGFNAWGDSKHFAGRH